MNAAFGKPSLSDGPSDMHDLHLTSCRAACSQSEWIIELHWGSGTRSCYCDAALRCSINEFATERECISVSVSEWPWVYCPNCNQTCDCVCKDGKWWVSICLVVHMWEMEELTEGDAWEPSLLEMWTLTWTAEYISLLCPPPQRLRCVSHFFLQVAED